MDIPVPKKRLLISGDLENPQSCSYSSRFSDGLGIKAKPDQENRTTEVLAAGIYKIGGKNYN